MRYFLVILCGFCTIAFAQAAELGAIKHNKIMVVEFELREVLPFPNVKQELERTT